MPKPVLYYNDASPPVRSCLMLIKMLDIDVEYKSVDLFKGGQFDENFLKINPSHTLPTLVHDKLILTDSHAILMYLCEKFQSKAWRHDLLPKNIVDRTVVVNMLFFECSVVFRRDSDFLSDIVRKGFANIDYDYHERKVLEAYTIMETLLKRQGNAKYMAGRKLTLADISLVTTCSTLDMVIPIATDGKWPLLNAWLEEMKRLPEYEINAKGLANLRCVMERMGKFKFPSADNPRPIAITDAEPEAET